MEEEIELLQCEINNIYLKNRKKYGFIPKTYFEMDLSQGYRDFHKDIYLEAERRLMFRVSEMGQKELLTFIQACNRVWNKEINGRK
jgi:hypothetical protein